jgi:hypothetical protein
MAGDSKDLFQFASDTSHSYSPSEAITINNPEFHTTLNATHDPR